MYQVLMVTEELDIGLRLTTIHTITQVGVADCWVHIFLLVLFMKVFIVIREVI